MGGEGGEGVNELYLMEAAMRMSYRLMARSDAQLRANVKLQLLLYSINHGRRNFKDTKH
jgi:hypothetical protein